MVSLFLSEVLAETCCCSAPVALSRFHFESVQMGGPWSIEIYAPDEASAKTATDLAFERVKQINDLFSDYNDSSELTSISQKYQAGEPIAVSPEFLHLTKIALEYSPLSHGGFDITVGPATDLWRRSRRKKNFPTPEKWEEAHSRMGFEKLQINAQDQTLAFSVPKMKLDFGAIAKGYAADEALKVLQSRGYAHALINGNGNFAAGGPPPDKTHWIIAIEELAVTNLKEIPVAQLPRVAIKSMGIATSGDLYQYYEHDGKRYSHIIDPRSGMPMTTRRLVTVIAENGTVADALATMVCVDGNKYLCEILKTYPCAAIYCAEIVDDQIKSWQTPNWNSYLKHD